MTIRPLAHLRRDWAHRFHVCTSPRRRLRRDRARRSVPHQHGTLTSRGEAQQAKPAGLWLRGTRRALRSICAMISSLSAGMMSVNASNSGVTSTWEGYAPRHSGTPRPQLCRAAAGFPRGEGEEWSGLASVAVRAANVTC